MKVSREGKEPTFTHVPDSVAVAAMQGKQAMLPAAFKTLLPELKARAFTIAGVQQMATIERVQKKVAEIVTEGREWKTVRGEIAAELVEALGGGAEARAQLLLRTHGFQAYATARHQEQVAQSDIFPYWQYVTAGDNSVRESHVALDGRVFKADDPFWGDHYPPWDFGCRCIVIACNEEEVATMREEDAGLAPIARRVLEGSALESARQGLVSRGVGDINPLDVSAPGPGGYKWHPTYQQMKLSDIKHPPEIMNPMVEMWGKIPIGDGRTVLEWLLGKPAPQQPLEPRRTIKPVSEAVNVRAKDDAINAAARHALDVINKVHTDGILPKTPLTSPLGMSNGTWGEYWFFKKKIHINPQSPHPATTVSHEIGHLLDNNGLHSPKKQSDFASETLTSDAHVNSVVDALSSSGSIAAIRGSGLDADTKNYLLDKTEMFARAYSQFIATQSRDAVMLGELRSQQQSISWYYQWSDADFAPIGTAMENLFKQRGWMQ